MMSGKGGMRAMEPGDLVIVTTTYGGCIGPGLIYIGTTWEGGGAVCTFLESDGLYVYRLPRSQVGSVRFMARMREAL